MALEAEERARRERAFRLVGQMIDGIVTQTCARHYLAPTQEHQFTSKITDRIESELQDLNVSGLRVRVHAQDFPDKGRGSWEKKSGADVYISVVLDAPDQQVNKGMIIQSKWHNSSSREMLADQTQKMKERTKSSYVWVYGPSSITVVPSDDVEGGKLDFSNAMTVGALITEGLRCNEGDPALGRNLDVPIPQSLTAMMERLALKRGFSVTLTEEADEDA